MLLSPMTRRCKQDKFLPEILSSSGPSVLLAFVPVRSGYPVTPPTQPLFLSPSLHQILESAIGK